MFRIKMICDNVTAIQKVCLFIVHSRKCQMKKTKLKKIFAITFSAVSITAVIIANNRCNKNIPSSGTHTATKETINP